VWGNDVASNPWEHDHYLEEGVLNYSTSKVIFKWQFFRCKALCFLSKLLAGAWQIIAQGERDFHACFLRV
jgi:hypothetical protein